VAREAGRAGRTRASQRLYSELDHLTGLRREARKALVAECRRHPASKLLLGGPTLERGLRPELVRVTVARKIAAVTLSVWKSGGRFDAGEGMKKAA
jgi:hypothetical protein